MRAVKCKVVMPERPTAQEALEWINEVGWDHVSCGNCSLAMCILSKQFIDKGLIKCTSTPTTKKHHPYLYYKAMLDTSN